MKRHGLLINGDCVGALSPMREGFVDMIMTSPPYGEMRSYNGFDFSWDKFTQLGHQMYRILKPGGTLVWVTMDQTKGGSESGLSFEQCLYLKNTVGFLIHDTMIYFRNGPPLTRRRYEQAFEYMFVLTKGVPKTFNGLREPKLYPEKQRDKRYGRYSNDTPDMGRTSNRPDKLRGNVWKPKMGKGICTDPYGHKHPAIYPEELAKDHVVSWTHPGDIVLDPMMGSGTTGKMAMLMGRKFIGIDCSLDYVKLAARRMGLNKAIVIGEQNGTQQNQGTTARIQVDTHVDFERQSCELQG